MTSCDKCGRSYGRNTSDLWLVRFWDGNKITPGGSSLLLTQSRKLNRQETHIAAMLGHYAKLVATLQVRLDDSLVVLPANIPNNKVVILVRTSRPIPLPKSA